MEQRLDSVNVGVTSCPECWTLLLLDRPVQGEGFPCPVCASDLRVAGPFVVALGYGTNQRIHHLNREGA